jgi:hypothetical protein
MDTEKQLSLTDQALDEFEQRLIKIGMRESEARKWSEVVDHFPMQTKLKITNLGRMMKVSSDDPSVQLLVAAGHIEKIASDASDEFIKKISAAMTSHEGLLLGAAEKMEEVGDKLHQAGADIDGTLRDYPARIGSSIETTFATSQKALVQTFIESIEKAQMALHMEVVRYSIDITKKVDEAHDKAKARIEEAGRDAAARIKTAAEDAAKKAEDNAVKVARLAAREAAKADPFAQMKIGSLALTWIFSLIIVKFL